MYPKVRVREEKFRDDEHVAVGLQMVESLYLHVPSSPEKEHRDGSAIFIARVPKSPLQNLVPPTISTSKDDSTSSTEAEKNYEKIVEKEKPNIKATPVMRPRAVLSSPDNDAVIGNKNRIKAERPKVLRKHDMVPNRHVNAQCKVSPTHISCNNQIDTTFSNDAPDNKSDLKGKKGSAMAGPGRRRYLRPWKS
ncbi:Atp-dependent rna helicase dbp-7 [Melia azedarach]|uniref:Atp-dependent rna helicase dbp-7 n=1 Tax=Melia azedarach TaxID=155640 RepID=A0ACC1YHE2_MELAZ|nr:Atp-dependent rna helicase dbp-7 [Melia azedarach]